MRRSYFLLLNLLVAPAAWALPIVSVTDFPASDWSGATKLSGPGTVSGASFFANALRQISINTAQNTTTEAGEVHTLSTYTPSVSGPVSALLFSMRYDSSGAFAGERYRFLIRQDGSYYQSPDVLPLQLHAPYAFSAADFSKIGTFGTGGSNPDWTGTGSTLEFGYFFSFFNGHIDGFPSGTAMFVDTFDVAHVPEPNTALVAGLALLALGCYGRSTRLRP